MIVAVAQVEVAPAPVPAPPPPGNGAASPVGPVLLTRQPCASAGTDTEVVVCGRKDQQAFRLGPEPSPPPADNLLSRPLRWQIAPGVSLGFQRGGGFGLRTEFGPGRKTGEGER